MKKRMKKLLAVIGVLILVAFLIRLGVILNYSNQKRLDVKQQAEEELIKENQVEIEKEIMEDNLKKSQIFISQLKADPEIVVLDQEGYITIKDDKTPDNNHFSEWLINSEISLKVYFKAKVAIKQEDVLIKAKNNGKVNVTFSKKDFFVSSIEIEKIVPVEKRSIFGNEYTPAETSALVLLCQDKIKLDLEKNDELKQKAEDSFKKFITDVANRVELASINVIEND